MPSSPTSANASSFSYRSAASSRMSTTEASAVGSGGALLPATPDSVGPDQSMPLPETWVAMAVWSHEPELLFALVQEVHGTFIASLRYWSSL